MNAIRHALKLGILYFCLLPIANGSELELLLSDVSWPEGPHADEDGVFFVAYGAHQVLRWNHGHTEVLWTQEGCGPASLAKLAPERFLVSCYDSHSLVEIDAQGRIVRQDFLEQWNADWKGPNDFALDGQGGVYISLSGAFDPAAPPTGKILYRNAKGEYQVFGGQLHYPNGLALTPDGKSLLVAEHLAARLSMFSIENGGLLSRQSIWKHLDEIIERPTDAPLTYGIDGLKVDQTGLIYLANYGAGRIVIADLGGQWRENILVPFPYLYVDNIALDSRNGDLYITAVRDDSQAPYPGAFFRWKK